MGEEERRDFLVWYETQEPEPIFDNKGACWKHTAKMTSQS